MSVPLCIRTAVIETANKGGLWLDPLVGFETDTYINNTVGIVINIDLFESDTCIWPVVGILNIILSTGVTTYRCIGCHWSSIVLSVAPQRSVRYYVLNI